MTKKLSAQHKEARRIVRAWGKAMRPFADIHTYQGNGHDSCDTLEVDQRGTKVEVENLGDFYMRACCGLPNGCEFAYSREVAPFERLDDNGRVVGDSSGNKELAFGLLEPLKPCYDADGFEGFVGGYAYAMRANSSPSITFVKRNATTDTFDVFLELSRMTDRFLDGHLKNIEQNREMPFRYVVRTHQEFPGHLTVKTLDSFEDLSDAKFVIEAAIPWRGGSVDGSTIYAAGDAKGIERYVGECRGRVLSVDEFVRGGALDER